MNCMTPSSPHSRRWTVAAALAGLLLAASPIGAQRESAVPPAADLATITHVLNRLGFGPRPGDVERVRTIGLAAYIEQQLHPERIADDALAARLAEFTTLALSQAQLASEYFAPAEQLQRQQQQQQRQAQARTASDPAMAATPPAMTPEQMRAQLTPEQRMIQQSAQRVPQELMQAKVLRAVMSERQLEEVLVDFWFNHFNVFLGKGQVRQYVTTYEREAIRPHVLGSFRDRLGATAQHPPMLFDLDNFQSQAPADAPRLAAPDDLRSLRPGQRPQLGRIGRPGQMPPRLPPMPPNRQQRGLNENYARELMELHTLGVDGGYTQQDVIELARILTGWTIDQPRLGGAFIFRPQAHDAGAKKLLGVTFPAGRGEDEGERALDVLAAHPSTARHIAFKLAQRFVADVPPAALVDRAAKRFLETKGDLRDVTRTIVTSPEFFAADAYRAKVKTPFEFVVSAARATNATIVNPQPLVQALRDTLGMPLYGCQPPTGYSMTADAWVNTGALLSRMNFAVQLLAGGQPVGPNRGGRGAAPSDRPAAARGGLQLRPGQLARMPIQVSVGALAADTSETSRDRLIALMLAGQASASTTATLARAETPQHLIALTLGSPEFQRR